GVADLAHHLDHAHVVRRGDAGPPPGAQRHREHDEEPEEADDQPAEDDADHPRCPAVHAFDLPNGRPTLHKRKRTTTGSARVAKIERVKLDLRARGAPPPASRSTRAPPAPPRPRAGGESSPPAPGPVRAAAPRPSAGGAR